MIFINLINFAIQSTLIMDQQDYLKDLSEIKSLMHKSSKFMSLSGLSGIMAGVYALIGAAYAYWLVTKSVRGYLILDGQIFRIILLDLFLIALFTVATAIYLTTRKANKNGEKIFGKTAIQTIISFLIPLISGGAYLLIILNQQKYGQTAALMLIFYGLALVNASRYTLSKIQYLGYIEIILGLICAIIPGFGFWLWVLGFGVMHIIYGIFMHFKYDRKLN